MSEDVDFVVALMLGAVLAAAGLPSENIVYPRIIQSRDQNGEKTLYIRPGLVLSLEKSRVFSDNFVFSIDDGVNRQDKLMNGKELEKNLYQDRDHSSVVSVEEEEGAVQVRGTLSHKFSIEPIASGRRSEDDLIAHRLLDLEDIDNPLGDDSVTKRRLVNLMYKQLTKPRIQFIVLSITKLTNYTFSYLRTHPKTNRTFIDLCKTIGTMNRYSNRMFNRTTQDAIVYVSGLSGAGISGCSFGCRVCKKNPITTQSMRVIDQPRLSDAQVLAHKMGHLLGMNHEGECPRTYTPGNEKLRCKKQEFGYVLGSGKPPHYFSRCLQDQVRGCLM
ncbi:uncharacterized protein LOC120838078 [Ixodes scapularis]|uniref:uncharacterized protein LOC120838078 n=1 Tax=Ixodes scapularis TaxID=6945 RepID=UPI001A9DFE39|nr:uncharacterized protein LOC120838078 [Ixodes scapularis]